MTHSLMDTGKLSAQMFTMVDEQMTPLGVVGREQDLEINGFSFALGKVKRYTGLIPETVHADELTAVTPGELGNYSIVEELID